LFFFLFWNAKTRSSCSDLLRVYSAGLGAGFPFLLSPRLRVLRASSSLVSAFDLPYLLWSEPVEASGGPPVPGRAHRTPFPLVVGVFLPTTHCPLVVQWEKVFFSLTMWKIFFPNFFVFCRERFCWGPLAALFGPNRLTFDLFFLIPRLCLLGSRPDPLPASVWFSLQSLFLQLKLLRSCLVVFLLPWPRPLEPPRKACWVAFF